MPKQLLIIAIIALMYMQAKAQKQSQVWIDYRLQIPFAEQFSYFTTATYKDNVNNDSWRSYEIIPGVEWRINKRFNLIGSIGGFYTEQTADRKTIEIKPAIASRFLINPDHRVLFAALARFEYRNVYHTETESWKQSTRSRFRLETIVPLNRQRFTDIDVFYALADAEVFIVIDEDVNERYANLVRYRVGAGYRPSDSWRFELIFSVDQTKNTIDDDSKETTNVIRFRVLHFFKVKPVIAKEF